MRLLAQHLRFQHIQCCLTPITILDDQGVADYFSKQAMLKMEHKTILVGGNHESRTRLARIVQ